MRHLKTFWRRREGSTAVEFGLVAAPFIVLLFGALQLFLLALAQQLLETAAEASGRLILTGQATSLSQAQFQQAVCKYIPAIINCSSVIIDAQVSSSFSNANTSTPTLTYDQNGNLTNTWQYNTGSAGSIVVLRLIYQWPLFNLPGFQLVNLPNGARLIMATAVFKNESF